MAVARPCAWGRGAGCPSDPAARPPPSPCPCRVACSSGTLQAVMLLLKVTHPGWLAVRLPATGWVWGRGLLGHWAAASASGLSCRVSESRRMRSGMGDRGWRGLVAGDACWAPLAPAPPGRPPRPPPPLLLEEPLALVRPSCTPPPVAVLVLRMAASSSKDAARLGCRGGGGRLGTGPAAAQPAAPGGGWRDVGPLGVAAPVADWEEG
ncbi:hypothetical protein V8C86DRAFT_2509229 [Haematococcus lacustris]